MSAVGNVDPPRGQIQTAAVQQEVRLASWKAQPRAESPRLNLGLSLPV